MPDFVEYSVPQKKCIAYCLQMNRTQKQMVALIHSINATWGVADLNIDGNDDDDNNDDSSETNTDDNTDFQEEEE